MKLRFRIVEKIVERFESLLGKVIRTDSQRWPYQLSRTEREKISISFLINEHWQAR